MHKHTALPPSISTLDVYTQLTAPGQFSKLELAIWVAASTGHLPESEDALRAVINEREPDSNLLLQTRNKIPDKYTGFDSTPPSHCSLYKYMYPGAPRVFTLNSHHEVYAFSAPIVVYNSDHDVKVHNTHIGSALRNLVDAGILSGGPKPELNAVALDRLLRIFPLPVAPAVAAGIDPTDQDLLGHLQKLRDGIIAPPFIARMFEMAAQLRAPEIQQREVDDLLTVTQKLGYRLSAEKHGKTYHLTVGTATFEINSRLAEAICESAVLTPLQRLNTSALHIGIAFEKIRPQLRDLLAETDHTTVVAIPSFLEAMAAPSVPAEDKCQVLELYFESSGSRSRHAREAIRSIIDSLPDESSALYSKKLTALNAQISPKKQAQLLPVPEAQSRAKKKLFSGAQGTGAAAPARPKDTSWADAISTAMQDTSTPHSALNSTKLLYNAGKQQRAIETLTTMVESGVLDLNAKFDITIRGIEHKLPVHAWQALLAGALASGHEPTVKAVHYLIWDFMPDSVHPVIRDRVSKGQLDAFSQDPTLAILRAVAPKHPSGQVANEVWDPVPFRLGELLATRRNSTTASLYLQYVVNPQEPQHLLRHTIMMSDATLYAMIAQQSGQDLPLDELLMTQCLTAAALAVSGVSNLELQVVALLFYRETGALERLIEANPTSLRHVKDTLTTVLDNSRKSIFNRFCGDADYVKQNLSGLLAFNDLFFQEIFVRFYNYPGIIEFLNDLPKIMPQMGDALGPPDPRNESNMKKFESASLAVQRLLATLEGLMPSSSPIYAPVNANGIPPVVILNPSILTGIAPSADTASDGYDPRMVAVMEALVAHGFTPVRDTIIDACELVSTATQEICNALNGDVYRGHQASLVRCGKLTYMVALEVSTPKTALRAVWPFLAAASALAAAWLAWWLVARDDAPPK